MRERDDDDDDDDGDDISEIVQEQAHHFHLTSK